MRGELEIPYICSVQDMCPHIDNQSFRSFRSILLRLFRGNMIPGTARLLLFVIYKYIQPNIATMDEITIKQTHFHDEKHLMNTIRELEVGHNDSDRPACLLRLTNFIQLWLFAQRAL